MKTPLMQISTASLKMHALQNALTVLVMALAVALCVVLCAGYTAVVSMARDQEASTYGAMDATLMDSSDAELAEIAKRFPIGQCGTIRAVASVEAEAVGDQQPLIVGSMDQSALELVSVAPLSGRLPQAAGEIALPETALYRMGYGKALDQQICLWLRSTDGRLTRQETYTVVGILPNYMDVRTEPHNWQEPIENASPHTSKYGDTNGNEIFNALRTNIVQCNPTLLIAEGDAAALADKFGAERVSYPIAFAPGADSRAEMVRLAEKLYQDGQYERMSIPLNTYYKTFIDLGDAIGTLWRHLADALLVGCVGLLVAVAVGGGIGAAFQVRLEHKRRQLGMLHAIGASRAQAAQIALGEAGPLMLCALPIGVLVGLGMAKFGVRMLAQFVSIPVSRWFDPWLTAVCALLSAALMLYFAARPSLKLYRLSPIEAMKALPKSARKRRARPAMAAVATAACIALAVYGPVLLSSFQGYFDANLSDDYDIVNISGGWGRSGSGLFSPIDADQATYGMDTAQATRIRAVEGVVWSSTERTHRGGALLLTDAQLGDYVMKQLDMDPERPLEDYSDRGLIVAGTSAIAGLPKDKHVWYSGLLSYHGICGLDDEGLLAMEGELMDGQIRLDKLRTGEEVLVGAPTLYIDRYDNGLSVTTNPIEAYTETVGNDSFRVGDEISFTTQYAGGERIVRSARIGALVNSSPGQLFLHDQAFQAWGLKEPVTNITLHVASGSGYEASMQQLSILAAQRDMSIWSQGESMAGLIKTRAALMALVWGGLGVLGAIAIAQLVGNAVNRLQGRTRELALLRAVGMDVAALRRRLRGEALREGLLTAGIGILIGLGLILWTASRGIMPLDGWRTMWTPQWWRELMALMPWGTMAACVVIPCAVLLAVAAWYVRRTDGTSIVEGLMVVDA